MSTTIGAPADAERAPETPRRRRRPRLRWILVLAGLWLVAAGVMALLGGADLRAGRADARAALQLEPAALVRGEAASTLADAERRFSAAGSKFGHPLLAPARVVPWLGTQVRSLTAMSDAAATMAEAGEEASRGLAGTVEGLGDPGTRVDALRRAAAALARTERTLGTVDLGPSRSLAGPLDDGRRHLAELRDDLHTTAGDAGRTVAAMADLLEGPRRYLLFAANNAEMRAGAGMFLQAGLLETVGGRITLSGLEPTHQIPVPPGVALEGDLATHWGWLEPQREWRNLMTSPHFDVAAPLAARMWEAAGRGPVNGVLAVDPIALQAVLRATGDGDVDLPNGPLPVDDLADELLHVQYTRFPEFTDKPERRERLGEIVGAAFASIDSGAADPVRMLEELVPAARGRHVLAWAAEPSEQQAWETAGVSGRLTPESVLVGSVNRGGNKLDYFLPLEVAIDVDGGRDRRTGRMTVTARNDAPADGPADVIGPHPGLDLDAGAYRGLLVVHLPTGASDIAIDGVTTFAAAGRDGPTRFVALPFDLERGATRSFDVTFSLPPTTDTVRIEPSGRWPTTRWRHGDTTWSDTEPRTLEL